MTGRSAPETERSRIPLRWLLRVAGTVAALALVAWWLPAKEILRAMGSVPPATWPAAIAAYLAAHLIGVAKWRLLINTAGAGLRQRRAAQAYYWGLFGNLFLPSIVGGDIVRAGVAMPHVRSKSALLLGSVVDRVQDVIGLGVLAGIGALLAPRALDGESRRVFTAFAAIMIVGVAAGLATVRFFPARLVPGKGRRLLVKVRAAIRATAERPGALAASFLLGLALQSLLVALNWRLGLLMGIPISFHVWLFVWPLAKIAGLMPVTQGGIGVREVAQAALFAPFGVSAVAAVATGLVFEVVILSGGLIGGGIATMLQRQSQGRTRSAW